MPKELVHKTASPTINECDHYYPLITEFGNDMVMMLLTYNIKVKYFFYYIVLYVH